MYKRKSVLLLGLISTLLLSGSIFSGLLPITVFASSEEDDEGEDGDSTSSNQDTQPQEADTNTDNLTSEEQQQTPEPTSPSIAVGEPNPCAKPDDGRPQPNKGANKDVNTWKVVPMKDDPSLFKVVDSSGINVADLFHSKINAEQYIAHFVCAASPTPTPAPSPTPTPPLPTESTPDMPDYGAGGIPAPPPKVLLPHKCVNNDYFVGTHIGAQTCAQVVEYPHPTVPTEPSEVVASVEQWIDGRLVYDNLIPKPIERDTSPAPDVPPCPDPNRPGIPCKVKQPPKPSGPTTPSGPYLGPVSQFVYEGIIGDYEVDFYLILDREQHSLSLTHCKYTPEKPGGPNRVEHMVGCVDRSEGKDNRMNLFTWP